ncbi:UNVERIFIED_CONTAM: hypothetical protein GTU68_015910 [Idotea baltica]|nr:hypothetical protein [Idotea baltica]
MLPIAAPVILMMAVAIRLESKGNPFFVQQRIGLGAKSFPMLKMRTLFSDKFGIREWHHELTLDDDRITKVGRFLRRTKLDELPQLLHVLSGKMSLVGPRPDIPEQVALYSPRQRERLNAKPGLTGIAQVSGNTFLSWPVRIELDRWYIKNASFILDLKIVFQTMVAIARGETKAFDGLGAISSTEEIHESEFHQSLDQLDSHPAESQSLASVE